MSAEQPEGTRVYDRLVGVDAEGHLPPVVATQLKGDPGEPGEPGKPGSPGPAGVSVESVERAGDDTEAKAVFRLSDESTHEVALPRGPQGAKGDPGATVNFRDNNDGTVTIEGGAAA